MKIFHILSNYRWTERAEPAADLACGQNAHGATTILICGKGKSPTEDAIFFRAAKKGLPVIQLLLPKHVSMVRRLFDVGSLRRLIALHRPDVLHTHMTNAALTVAYALRKTKTPPLWVHTSYEAGPPSRLLARLRRPWLPRMDGLTVISEPVRKAVVESGFLDGSEVRVIEPGIDVSRFQKRSGPATRSEFNLAERDFVVGLVLRARPRRRIDLVLEAIRDITPDIANIKLLHIGRGAVSECIEKTAAQRGIANHVVLGGYCREERLPAAYQAMDCLVYLLPGTDPSCRTVKEAMAAGVPPIVSGAGHLPNLVQQNQTGFVTPMSSESLAAAITRMARNGSLRDQLAHAAAEHARKEFNREIQAQSVLAFYASLQSSG